MKSPLNRWGYRQALAFIRGETTLERAIYLTQREYAALRETPVDVVPARPRNPVAVRIRRRASRDRTVLTNTKTFSINFVLSRNGTEPSDARIICRERVMLAP